MGAPMQTVPPAVQGVLQRIKMRTAATAQPGEDDWFVLIAPGVQNSILFQKIERDWPEIVGPEKMNFALVHCETGPNAGVWLHHLATSGDRATYAPGIHRIPTC